MRVYLANAHNEAQLMPLSYTTLDVFTDRPFGGNPLAVFCDQPALSTAQMQVIAREFNLSETVFIVPPREPRALRRLRIFSPSREMPFAGHPTLGAVQTLVEAGIANIPGETGEFALELEVGLVPIKVTRRTGALPFLQLTAARLPETRGTAPSPAALARMLQLEEREILHDRDRAEAWSCGLPFLFVPVRDRAVLARAKPDSAAWSDTLKGAWATEAFVFCRDPELPGSQIRARMFAPDLGIGEDPATGSAVAAFGGYLAAREPAGTGTHHWTIEQGFEMGRPSLLRVQVDTSNGKPAAVHVGGTAVTVSEGRLLHVPESD
jgi:trans-2,3-dihydro-3-hydroxyanthranilate isomerase